MLILLCCTSARVRAQKKEVFAAVPLELRERLSERLKLLVERQKTQQWDKQYDLIAADERKSETKEAFVANTRRAYAKQERTLLIDFVPFRSDLLQGKTYKLWVVFACSQATEKGRKVNMLTAVRAYRERGDWFFSVVESVAPAGVGNPCKPVAPDASLDQKREVTLQVKRTQIQLAIRKPSKL
jgi:hypothetical protein